MQLARQRANTLLQYEKQKKEKEIKIKILATSTIATANKIANENQGKLSIETPTAITSTNSCCNINLIKNVPCLLPHHSVSHDVANKNDDICIQPRNCKTQTLATTNVNYRCITQAHSNSNIFLNTIISILHCKQFNSKRQQQQYHHLHHYFAAASSKMTTRSLPHQPTQQHKLLSRLCNFNHSTKDLVYIMSIIFLPYLLIHSVLHLPLMAAASCGDEPSRSCEAICRPVWSQDNYLSTMLMHPSNLTSEPFSADDYNCTIRAVVLLPDDDRYLASLRRVVPILKVAVQYLHASGLLPSYIHFDWMPQDDKCDAAFATVKAMDGIVKNCAHVLFGPVCDYSLAAVGRIAKYFNSYGTPLITVGGSTFDFEKPKTKCTDEFYMLLRTGMLSFETLSKLTISVMKRNNWSRSIFFYDRDGQRNVAGLHTCYLMMTSLGQQMRKENMTFAQYPLKAKLMNRTEEMIREIGNKHSGMLSEEAQEAMNKEYRNCRLFHSRKNSRISTNEDVMHYLQISSDPYINSFRMRMKLKKLEYHDDIKKLLIE